MAEFGGNWPPSTSFTVRGGRGLARRVTDAEAFLLAAVLGVQLIDLFPGEEVVLQVVRNPEP